MLDAQPTNDEHLPADDAQAIIESMRRRRAEISACNGISTKALEDDIVRKMIIALQSAQIALSVSRPINQISVIPHNNHCQALRMVDNILVKIREE